VYYGSTADPEERQAAHANGLGAQVLKGAIVGPFRVLGLGSLVAELLAVVMAVSAAVGTWWRRTDAKRPLPGTLVRGAFVAGAVVTAAARGLVGRLVAHLEAHGRFSLEGILTGIQNGGQNPFGGDLLRQYLWSAPWLAWFGLARLCSFLAGLDCGAEGGPGTGRNPDGGQRVFGTCRNPDGPPRRAFGEGSQPHTGKQPDQTMQEVRRAGGCSRTGLGHRQGRKAHRQVVEGRMPGSLVVGGLSVQWSHQNTIQ